MGSAWVKVLGGKRPRRETSNREQDGRGCWWCGRLSRGLEQGGVFSALRIIGGRVWSCGVPFRTRPVTTSHSGLSREERATMGIADGLVRVACGIEAAEDLCADFAQALDGV